MTGTPGAGKSYRLVCGIAEALLEGKFVATNIPLAPDWHDRIARRALLRNLIPGRHARVADTYASRLLYSDDVNELLRATPGCTRCGAAVDFDSGGTHCTKGHRLTEGRGLWVLDEAHEHLNSRLWDSEERQRIVQWISRSRHRGWDVELGTQALDSLDKQLRDRVEYEVVTRNLKRARLMGLPLSPVDLFLCIHVWVGGPRSGKRHIAKRRLYLRDGRSRIYDTHGLRFMQPAELDGAAPIALPLPTPPREAKPRRWRRNGGRTVGTADPAAVEPDAQDVPAWDTSTQREEAASSDGLSKVPDVIGPRRDSPGS